MHAYRHLFHAGNFADVFKHALLVRLAMALARKDKPFLYLETHAGLGQYDLAHPWAQKNAEFAAGIARLWQRADLPGVLAPYLAPVRAANPGDALRFYPGSPQLVRPLLRPGDRMVLAELNAEDCRTLAGRFRNDRTVHVECADGYRVLKAHLPSRERRALVFVDASFDTRGEFDRLVIALVEAHHRFATGVYALWYPLMSPAAMAAFARDVVRTGIRKILAAEIVVRETFAASAPLRGCGMLVVNPPFGFEGEAGAIGTWLAPVLALEGAGSFRLEWRVRE
jgi:23S rRNA (adenine2030-N6)-methyltransferase